jgi:two-component system, sensor histidine kinase and response regulator
MTTAVATISVLLVDDDRDNFEMYAEYLHSVGMVVRAVPAALDAIALVETAVPDVIVTDLHLGGMSGITMTRAIKENPATASIPVVLLTGEAFGGVKAQAKAAGCDEMCLKPYPPDELGNLIVRLVARARG